MTRCARALVAISAIFRAWRKRRIADQLQADDPPIRPPKSSNAASAISGPIPAGSPMVMRIGSWRCSADLDIGVALQVAHIAPRHGGNLLVEQLIFSTSWRVGIT